jgi:hypothetical protein
MQPQQMLQLRAQPVRARQPAARIARQALRQPLARLSLPRLCCTQRRA